MGSGTRGNEGCPCHPSAGLRHSPACSALRWTRARHPDTRLHLRLYLHNYSVPSASRQGAARQHKAAKGKTSTGAAKEQQSRQLLRARAQLGHISAHARAAPIRQPQQHRARSLSEEPLVKRLMEQVPRTCLLACLHESSSCPEKQRCSPWGNSAPWSQQRGASHTHRVTEQLGLARPLEIIWSKPLLKQVSLLQGKKPSLSRLVLLL